MIDTPEDKIWLPTACSASMESSAWFVSTPRTFICTSFVVKVDHTWIHGHMTSPCWCAETYYTQSNWPPSTATWYEEGKTSSTRGEIRERKDKLVCRKIIYATMVMTLAPLNWQCTKKGFYIQTFGHECDLDFTTANRYKSCNGHNHTSTTWVVRIRTYLNTNW